jgi:hypothetical protein
VTCDGCALEIDLAAATPSGRMVANILMAVAQWESELRYPTGDLSLVRPAAMVIADGFRVEAIMVQRSLRRPAPWQTSSRITGRVQPHARTAAAVMVR